MYRCDRAASALFTYSRINCYVRLGYPLFMISFHPQSIQNQQFIASLQRPLPDAPTKAAQSPAPTYAAGVYAPPTQQGPNVADGMMERAAQSLEAFERSPAAALINYLPGFVANHPGMAAHLSDTFAQQADI